MAGRKDHDMAGRSVIITGAASGIGRASALAFAAAGARALAIIDVDAAGLAAVAGCLDGRPVEMTSMVADVGDPQQLTAAFRTAQDALKRIDVVHNNAGIITGEPGWPDTPIERIAEVVNVNVCGTLMGTRLAIDALRPHGGAVVNTASAAGLGPMPTDPVYAATKAAIISFTRSCGAMAAESGVRVNAVLPGLVDSTMIAKTGRNGVPARWLDRLTSTLELLSPERVAAEVVRLAADSTLSGETVIIANETRSRDRSGMEAPVDR